MLFPVLRQIAVSPEVSPVEMEIILPPIECMHREHDFIDELVEYLRQLTDDFQPPAWAVAEHRALLDELAAFATDTAEHVRKENEVLFPAALNLAPARDACAGSGAFECRDDVLGDQLQAVHRLIEEAQRQIAESGCLELPVADQFLLDVAEVAGR